MGSVQEEGEDYDEEYDKVLSHPQGEDVHGGDQDQIQGDNFGSGQKVGPVLSGVQFNNVSSLVV